MFSSNGKLKAQLWAPGWPQQSPASTSTQYKNKSWTTSLKLDIEKDIYSAYTQILPDAQYLKYATKQTHLNQEYSSLPNRTTTRNSIS